MQCAVENELSLAHIGGTDDDDLNLVYESAVVATTPTKRATQNPLFRSENLATQKPLFRSENLATQKPLFRSENLVPTINRVNDAGSTPVECKLVLVHGDFFLRKLTDKRNARGRESA